MVTDRDIWEQAIAVVAREYADLPAGKADRLAKTLAVIMRLKSELQAFGDGVDGAEICASCRGMCCDRGKFHFTVVDLLSFLTTRTPLFTPSFGRDDLCPYLGDAGCKMAPEYRPFNCVTFNCGQIEELLSPSQLERFYLLEKELRQLYAECERLCGNRFMQGLLINYERHLLGGGLPILGKGPGRDRGNDNT